MRSVDPETPPRIVGGALLAAVLLGVAGAALRWRNNPSACPYSQRLWVKLPRPFFTHSRLRGILAPESSQRILEVGPGIGYYALHTARWLSPGGTLEIVDIQQNMLDHTMRRAREVGLTNIVPTLGDAQDLPYPDDSFDAAYLVATLGEAPDQSRVLSELFRVLKPGGRLIVGEGLPDPHMVRFASLQQQASAEGLSFERRLGVAPAYFAAFRGA